MAPQSMPAVRILLIDCFDSFTYNLAQALSAVGAEVTVVRNDAVDVAGALALAPDGIVLSPGPGRPEDTGVCPPLLAELVASQPTLPVLGVCLGHQLIGLHTGAKVVRAREPIHGKVWAVRQTDETRSPTGDPLWRGVPDPLFATRYHSLAIDPQSLPRELEVTAATEEGEVMALRHRRYPWWGVQFHPESIGCPSGPLLLANFVAECSRQSARPSAAPATGN